MVMVQHETTGYKAIWKSISQHPILYGRKYIKMALLPEVVVQWLVEVCSINVLKFKLKKAIWDTGASKAFPKNRNTNKPLFYSSAFTYYRKLSLEKFCIKIQFLKRANFIQSQEHRSI